MTRRENKIEQHHNYRHGYFKARREGYVWTKLIQKYLRERKKLQIINRIHFRWGECMSALFARPLYCMKTIIKRWKSNNWNACTFFDIRNKYMILDTKCMCSLWPYYRLLVVLHKYKIFSHLRERERESVFNYLKYLRMREIKKYRVRVCSRDKTPQNI